MRVGLSSVEAARQCHGQKSRSKSKPSDPSTLKIKRAYFQTSGPSKPTGSPLPVGRVTSSLTKESIQKPIFTVEGSMGGGWKLRTGYTGTGAVVFPDSDKAAKDFLNSLQRPITARDRTGWFTYASRIGMANDVAERVWATLTKPSLRPKLSSGLVKEFEDVFEGVSWTGHGGHPASPLGMKMRHGGFRNEPPPTQSSQKHKGYTDIQQKSPTMGGKRSEPKPSFPFHTKAARDVWAKAEELIGLYPLENPTQLLKRAMSDQEISPLMDLTPEDEKLLRMAIDHAQNGPPKSLSRIGGAPGGPFNSSNPKTRGAP
jgi:hypothetical protein